ncbi:cell division control protein [Coemansia helicoidea]|uniref:Cell division control protein n=1 Tax=Coemansia helicoidea TaxID=1286919 RepID=A0ACC1KSU2_9FUNG|nr:cell division control protein [Coemansia helicoidea]
MLRTHLSDLIEVTAQRHYEQFRTSQLRQIKELRDQQAAGAAAGVPPGAVATQPPVAPLPHQPVAQV